MTLTAPSKNVAAFDKGRLAAGISATATTITVSPISKTVNGVKVKQGFDSTSGECLISHGGFDERISFEGSSVDATTKITTLTTCTRGLPTTNITPNFTGGTGKIWAKGASIIVLDSASYNQSSVFVNTTNAFTGANSFAGTSTFNAPVIVAGTTSYVKLPELTTTQRDALTGAEGMLIKNSTTGTVQQYVGGAWASVGTDATPNMSETVAGKGEIPTAAQRGAGTSVGETGARLVVSNDALVKTSSGAGDENKLPVLDATGKLASGFLPSTVSPYTISDKTANYTITTSDVGALFTNNGATSGITFTLPSASAGQYFKFSPKTYPLSVLPASGDNIFIYGVTYSIGISNRIAYDYWEMVALDETTWLVVGITGTGLSGGQKGYFTGGWVGGTHYNLIEDLNFIDETSVAITATLTSTSESHFGMGNTLYCYIYGGTTDLGTTGLNTIQRLTVSVPEVKSVITATLDTSRSAGASVMSGTKGYAMGGIVSSTVQTTISALVFSTEAEANIAAVLATATWRQAGSHSSTKGYAMSGSQDSGGTSRTATIRALTFSDDTSATLGASFSAADALGSGVSSSLAGYQMGGDQATTTIRKLLFSSEATSNLAATLDSAHNAGAGVSGLSKGYCAGGGSSTAIDDLNFSSEASVAISATLNTGRGYLGSAYPWSV